MKKREMRINLVMFVWVFCFLLVPIDNPLFIKETNPSKMTNVISLTSIDWHSWLEESEPIRIFGNHYFNETYDFPGKGTPEEPFIIENLYINLNKTRDGVAINVLNVDAHFIIRNCVFQGFNIWYDDPDGAWMSMLGVGIHFWDVSNGLIQNCTFLGSSTGVYINECENVSVYGNRIYGTTLYNESGIITYAENAEMEGINIQTNSTGINVEDNKVFNCTYGIHLLANVTRSTVHNNTVKICNHAIGLHVTLAKITNNTCTHNFYGGISLAGSFNNTVANNTSSHNGQWGFHLDELSANNTFVGNTAELNGITKTPPSRQFYASLNAENGYGIVVCGSNTSVIWNIFDQNDVNAKNDAGTNTYAYNYWSDYTGYDFDGDGFGDTPYVIQGNVPAEDPHPRGPLLVDVNPPIIEDIESVSFDVTDAEKIIIWNVSDETPKSYWIYINDSLEDSGDWNGSDIQVDVSDLGVGAYNVTLVLDDMFGNIASEQLILIISETVTTSTATTTESTSTTTSTPPSGFGEMMMLVILGAGAIVVVIIILVIKQRK